METITLGSELTYKKNTTRTSVFSRLLTWTQTQENNRLLWLSLGLGLHGCVITPITVFIALISGAAPALWMIAIFAMTATLIVNLAALPARITIPVFLTTVLVDVLIIAAALAGMFV